MGKKRGRTKRPLFLVLCPSSNQVAAGFPACLHGLESPCHGSHSVRQVRSTAGAPLRRRALTDRLGLGTTQGGSLL